MENSRKSSRSYVLAIMTGSILLGGGPIAQASDWYVSATGGLTFLGDESGATLTESTTLGNSTSDLELVFGSGFGAGGAVGRWFSDQVRGELEWLYRSNDNDSVTTSDGRSTSDGNFASTALSVNGYFHFSDARTIGQFSPYVGIGISYLTEIDIDFEGGDFGAAFEDIEDDGIGFQLMGGASYRQTENLRWTAELRWLAFGNADLERNDSLRVDGASYSPFGLFVGVSYEF